MTDERAAVAENVAGDGVERVPETVAESEGVESVAETVAQSTEGTAMRGDDLAAVRELALRAYPETVPELVAGDSVAALLASLEPAAAAYRRIAQGVTANTPAPTTPTVPTVPAGSAPPVTIDPDRLPSVEKIRRGLAVRR